MTHWTDDANCRGASPDLFFPALHDMAAWREARAVCRVCSVRTICLEENLHELHGVWGGTSPLERQRIRARRRRSA